MADEFFRTQMGQRYYEHTMPQIARQLEALNKNLEQLNKSAARAANPPFVIPHVNYGEAPPAVSTFKFFSDEQLRQAFPCARPDARSCAEDPPFQKCPACLGLERLGVGR